MDTGAVVFLMQVSLDVCVADQALRCVRLLPAPVIEPEYLLCDDCQKPFMDSVLSNSFDLSVCDKCRYLTPPPLTPDTNVKVGSLLLLFD